MPDPTSDPNTVQPVAPVAPADPVLDDVRAFVASDTYTAFVTALTKAHGDADGDARFKAHLDCISIGMGNLSMVSA